MNERLRACFLSCHNLMVWCQISFPEKCVCTKNNKSKSMQFFSKFKKGLHQSMQLFISTTSLNLTFPYKSRITIFWHFWPSPIKNKLIPVKITKKEKINIISAFAANNSFEFIYSVNLPTLLQPIILFFREKMLYLKFYTIRVGMSLIFIRCYQFLKISNIFYISLI